ncbi:MAG TPA: LysR substrate-binding domain-containing protein [Burkholderiaceae bacterium]|nr:LysR substrate-binding domain-containing protein [Burkholderiaceae bacterium]
MSRLPLHHLPAFLAVAKLQNLRAAAQTLHLTHSAVSQQIRSLEEQLGFELFERRGRRIVINPAGEALLRSVEPALAQLDDGAQAAAAAAAGTQQRLRVTTLPSFAQRWLLPRIGRWRARYPDMALEIDTSHQIVDLQREGFHIGIRQGRGPWPGLLAQRLFDAPMPIVLVGSPAAARRLMGASPEALAREPLLGDADLWAHWFAACGVNRRATPVASFNDAGLMLQATEQNLGLALARELLAADALADGRLVKLSDVAITYEAAYPYHFVYPPALQEWAPLKRFHRWLNEELELSRKTLQASVTDKSAPPALR